jgi:hypothetical protein
VEYRGAVGAENSQPVLIMPTKHAQLQLDWHAPYCGPRSRLLQIEVALTIGSLRTRPTGQPLMPACTKQKTHGYTTSTAWYPLRKD